MARDADGRPLVRQKLGVGQVGVGSIGDSLGEEGSTDRLLEGEVDRLIARQAAGNSGRGKAGTAVTGIGGGILVTAVHIDGVAMAGAEVDASIRLGMAVLEPFGGLIFWIVVVDGRQRILLGRLSDRS